MREFFTRLVEGLFQQSKINRRGNRRFRLAAEELENRVVPAVSLDSLALVNGTLNSSGEWECTDPTISGVVQDMDENHSARIEIDHDGDGNAESTWDQGGSSSSFQYDPRSVNSEISGAVQLRVRAFELDEDGVTVLNGTDWISLSYHIVPESVGNEEGGEGEGDGSGEPPEEFVLPIIDAFIQSEQAGDWYIFTGHVTGSAVNGATLTFSGILEGLTAIVDGDGNFTTSGYFPTGVQGIAYAQVTDGQGNTSEMVSLYVDIQNSTPSEGESGEGDSGAGDEEGGGESGDPGNGGDGEEGGEGDSGDPGEQQEQYVSPSIDSFAQTEQAGDWYIFTGHVTGSAVSGATVAFSGILDGLTAIVDGDGNFTTSGYFPIGVQGIAYAQVIDGQGTTSEMISLYVDIPNATP